MDKYNSTSLDSLCAALTEIMGVEKPKQAAEPCKELLDYAEKKLKGEKADRIFMYNPDAIAQWIYEKYPEFFDGTTDRTELALPFKTVMPSVTPVCFATMYTGAQPEVHGIKAYEKPVVKIDSVFDALIRAGKKCAIVADDGCSLSKIFLEREMDYFFYDTIEEINAKAADLIVEDRHDFIVVYNENYDCLMHRNGPESPIALAELHLNCHIFGVFSSLIEKHWKSHNSLVGFAMDHGCHEIDGNLGSHGLEMPEDLNITHFYKIYGREN